jgi:hypothetical protein
MGSLRFGAQSRMGYKRFLSLIRMLNSLFADGFIIRLSKAGDGSAAAV